MSAFRRTPKFWPSRKPQTLHITPFSYTMYYTFHYVHPQCTFHVSLSFLLVALESMSCPIKWFILIYKRSAIGQLNVQAATTKNEEHYTLSNKIRCLKRSLLFSLKFTLNQVFLSLSIPMTHCVGHNTDTHSTSNLKTIIVNVVYIQKFFKEYWITFVMISTLIDFTLLVLPVIDV